MLLAILSILTFSLNVYAQNSSQCYSNIDWNPCSTASQKECGMYQVPLDYTHPEVGNATLALARIKASKKPRLGTLFINPGGPGASGVAMVLSDGELISNIVNNQYDIVSWDPRGVAQSTPQISCGFTSQDDLDQFWNGSILAAGVEARGNFTDQDDLDNFFAGLNQTNSKLEQFGQKCMETNGEFLKYMGTASVVRDMVSLSDCLEGPGEPVNYWGFSYGTVIGNYFVNMFPERVGGVIIDGIVDSIAWATEQSYKSLATEGASSESTFLGFTQACAQAGPEGCSLAQVNSTSASISLEVQKLIDTAYDLHKAGDPNPDHTAAQIRFLVFSALYNPVTWDELASQLSTLKATFANDIFPNATALKTSRRMRPRVLKPRQNSNASEAAVPGEVPQVTITCVDSIDQDNVTTKQVFDELVRLTHEVLPMFGELLPIDGPFYCHRFPTRAVERFTGPFNHTLAHPIIVIGNEADPITSFANADKIAGTLGTSARLLKQNGFGHSSLAENSTCTQGVVRDYFLQGTLPSEGKVCEVNDVNLFPKNGSLISAATISRREIREQSASRSDST